MSARHTPGPWQIHCGYLIRSDVGTQAAVAIAELHSPYRPGIGGVHEEAEQAANARLIAAAPALLEALERIGGLCGHLRAGGCDASDLQGLEEGLREAVSIAEAAIAAARGES